MLNELLHYMVTFGESFSSFHCKKIKLSNKSKDFPVFQLMCKIIISYLRCLKSLCIGLTKYFIWEGSKQKSSWTSWMKRYQGYNFTFNLYFIKCDIFGKLWLYRTVNGQWSEGHYASKDCRTQPEIGPQILINKLSSNNGMYVVWDPKA